MGIYTIGYEGIDQKTFIDCLKESKIDVVADVRERPLSRKKGFSKNGLRESLLENDIEYLGCPSLGVPKEIRDKLKASGNYSSFFKKYRESLTSNGQQLDEILEIIKAGKKVALLCFEKDPNKCHRTVLAEQLRELGDNEIKINHLNPL